MGSSDSKPAEVVHEATPPTPPPNPELDKPWRKFDWGQKETLKEKLENFKPSSPYVKDFKILVAGQIGAGKSSFINSVDSTFQGRITSRALADSVAGGDSYSFTRKLKAYTIRSGKKSLPFVFKDIMGLEAEAMAGSQIEDIINTVFGYVKDGYEFNEKQALTHKDQHYVSDPTLSDQAFCLVYVVAADKLQLTDDTLIEKLKIVRKTISEKGIPQVVVMTKVDEACPLVNNDLRKIYTSKKIKQKIQMCSDKIGVPMSNIFPLKNYHQEIDTDDDIDALILKALEQIVQIADDRLLDIQSC